MSNDNQTQSRIEPAFTPHIINPDVEMIYARSRDFPATTLLAETLEPYYKIATNKLSALPINDNKHAQQVSPDRLPEALAKEVRNHLGELQSSAFALEAQGATERASEVRNVASTLFEMLKITQQLGTQQNLATAKTKTK